MLLFLVLLSLLVISLQSLVLFVFRMRLIISFAIVVIHLIPTAVKGVVETSRTKEVGLLSKNAKRFKTKSTKHNSSSVSFSLCYHPNESQVPQVAVVASPNLVVGWSVWRRCG